MNIHENIWFTLICMCFGCLDLYSGCLDLYFGVWACILDVRTCVFGVWTCILMSGLVFWVSGFVFWVSGLIIRIWPIFWKGYGGTSCCLVPNCHARLFLSLNMTTQISRVHWVYAMKLRIFKLSPHRKNMKTYGNTRKYIKRIWNIQKCINKRMNIH